MTPVLASELARIGAFRDLASDDLEWLASLMEEQTLEPGQVAVRERSPADRMFVVLEGDLRAREEAEPGSPTYLLEAGDVTGMLPFSRMREFTVTVRAIHRCRVASLPASQFEPVLQRIPELGRRLVSVMSDRIREMAREEVQRDKLIALGRLSAGLSHGLNNPAAALLRISDNVRSAMEEWRQASTRLEIRGLTPSQRQVLDDCERESVEALSDLPVLDALTRSDREEQIAQLLLQTGVRDAWQLSPTLADCGFELADLSCVADAFPAEALPDVLARFVSTLTIERLLSEMSMSARRISGLVQSLKDYSCMDQAPLQDVDVHRGIDSTLAVMQHRLHSGIAIVRDYDASAPHVGANGSELNQVWTALLDNAINAVGDAGEIRIRTETEEERVLIEIADNGCGIPVEIQDRVFDPFFTTRPEGEGTGLGLDIAFRVIRKHQGDIRFESVPGHTRFQVRLPLQQTAEGVAA